MEKKDYFRLQSKYACLTDYQERYRKELLDFINEAFEKHGNEFEYIRNSHDTWQRKVKECPIKGNPPVNISMVHDDDVCRERFRRHFTDNGEVYFEADEWDLDGYQFVKRVDIDSDINELETVEVFINAVLEQEQEEKKECSHPREFKKGERVCYENEHGEPYKAMVTHDQQSEHEEDEIELFIFLDEEDDDSQGIEVRKVKAREIYQLSEGGKTCPRCGEPLYDEHLEHMDYPYYCPWCQENFYGIEVQ